MMAVRRMENVPLSQQPLVVHNGNVCRFVVTEIRGDWKFQKAVLVLLIGTPKFKGARVLTQIA